MFEMSAFSFDARRKSTDIQGRITHEAGEAAASGPGRRQGPGPPGAKKIYKLGSKFLERKFAVF